MSENQKILERFSKLMALAESTTHEGERENAWAKINQLLTEYRLELSDLQYQKQEVVENKFDLTTSANRRWRLALMTAISAYLPATILYAGRLAWVYCKAKEWELFDFFYASVSAQLMRSAKSDCKRLGIPPERAQRWRVQYMVAAVEVVHVRFVLMRDEQRQALLEDARGQQALVLLGNDRTEVNA